MHMDPMLPRLVAALLLIVVVALALRRWGTPTLVVYLLAGVALGPEGLAVIADRDMLSRIGEFGVLFLLFFVGMEMSLPRLLEGWKVALGGTALQVVASLLASLAIGWFFGWPLGRSVLLGFVISLSSTAVVLRLLHDREEIDTPVGQDVVGILLAQDLAIVPMLMIITVLAGGRPALGQLGAQAVVGLAAVLAVISLRRQPGLFQRAVDRIGDDPELRLFSALLFCLGLSLITALAGLSAASGAFLAGLLLSITGRTAFAHHALDGLRVLLLATFFFAIGSLLEHDFLLEKAGAVAALTGLAFVTNMVVNTFVLRWLGRPWPRALLGGAYLSQIGELSFVLAAVGLGVGLIGEFAYRMTVSVIACTLVLSTVWIALVRPAERWIAGRAAARAAAAGGSGEGDHAPDLRGWL